MRVLVTNKEKFSHVAYVDIDRAIAYGDSIGGEVVIKTKRGRRRSYNQVNIFSFQEKYGFIIAMQ